MSNITLEQLTDVMIDKIKQGGEVYLNPTGSSMWPTIWHKRDRVVLKQCDTVQKYGIYLFRRTDGSIVLHRCVRVMRNSFWFRGDHQKKSRTEKNILQDQIIARVAVLYRKNRVFRCTSFFCCISYYILPLYKALFALYNFWRKLCEKGNQNAK